ncbi:phosphatase PAP2 family protein [bacterium]|nr:phosphatase PAP2 family protein [bacterium]
MRIADKHIPALRRYRGLTLHPLDRLSLGYLAVTGLLIALFHSRLPGWWAYLCWHAAAAAVILELVRAGQHRQSRMLDLARSAYPVLGFGAAWLELDALFTLVFPFYGTEIIVGLDKTIFGVHPTLWVETVFSPWLTELMNFFYAVYFLFLPTGTLLIFFRKGRQATLDFLFPVYTAYLSAFLFSLLFPVEGAWTALSHIHTTNANGGFFLALNHWIQNNGSVKGGAFPSVHVTGAFAIAFSAMKFEKRFAVAVFVLSLGVALSTVYCRYHHALDAAGGIVWAAAACIVAAAILKKSAPEDTGKS